MNEFYFFVAGMSTRYTAKPAQQVYRIFAGKEDTGLYFEPGEMLTMLANNRIVKAYDMEALEDGYSRF